MTAKTDLVVVAATVVDQTAGPSRISPKPTLPSARTTCPLLDGVQDALRHLVAGLKDETEIALLQFGKWRGSPARVAERRSRRS